MCAGTAATDAGSVYGGTVRPEICAIEFGILMRSAAAGALKPGRIDGAYVVGARPQEFALSLKEKQRVRCFVDGCGRRREGSDCGLHGARSGLISKLHRSSAREQFNAVIAQPEFHKRAIRTGVGLTALIQRFKRSVSTLQPGAGSHALAPREIHQFDKASLGVDACRPVVTFGNRTGVHPGARGRAGRRCAAGEAGRGCQSA